MRGPALCLVRKCWIIRSEVTRFRLRGTSPNYSLSYSANEKSLAVAFVFGIRPSCCLHSYRFFYSSGGAIRITFGRGPNGRVTGLLFSDDVIRNSGGRLPSPCLPGGKKKLQIPPLRYAPVGMTKVMAEFLSSADTG